MGTNENIRDAVHKELVTDPLIDAGDIVIEVVNGAVSLTGTVPSQAQCAEVVAAAHRVAGVTGVDNLLAVALPSGDFGDDAALAQLANQALAADRAVPDGVQATAREGSIFLTGTVSHNVQRVAAEDARGQRGRGVSITNEIEVQGDA